MKNMKEIKKLLLDGETVNVECKEAKNSMPKSVYETYSSFANTNGGCIILGVKEDKATRILQNRFTICGVQEAEKIVEDFWNTINGNKVNVNILMDKDVYIVEENNICIVVIEVPRADCKLRPVYIGENPMKGTYKRNREGDYHCSGDEIRAMIRDQNPDGNDGLVLEHYSIDDIDTETLKHYRLLFQTRNPEHVWNTNNDLEFLMNLGGYRKDRRKELEGLTLAGLLMFGKGTAIRDEFDNVFMDYRDENGATTDLRWNDRITYDGTWENNLFNFFTKVTPKLTAELRKPFKLEGMQRVDDTPIHKAVREAFVNMIIHADYMLEGTLKVIKISEGFTFTNPGVLKLPKEEIFKGGNSKPRNPRMQTMLRMVGYGDNAGSGFPSIVSTWAKEGWKTPLLEENTNLNQVTLTLLMKADTNELGSTTQTTQTTQTIPQLDTNEKKVEFLLTDKDRQILTFLKSMPTASQRDIAVEIGWDVNTVKYYTRKLKMLGILDRTGSSRKGKWVVKKRIE